MSNSTMLLPPGEEASRSGELLVIVCCLNTLAFIAYGLRIYSRATPAPHFGLDDFFITAGMISMLVSWVITILGIKSGNGTRAVLLQPQQILDAIKWSFVQFFPQIWAIAFIRTSIACLLLRFRHDRLWRVVLFILVALQLVMATFNTLTQALIAIPLDSFWDPSVKPGPWHIDPYVSLAAAYTNSIVGIITDLIFSIMPILFIRNISRPLRERIVLSALMGLGVLTTAASIVKASLIGQYGADGDYTWSAFQPMVWVLVEQVVAVIAASVPCLKALFEKCLDRLGLMSTKKTRAATSRAYGYGGYGARSQAFSLHSMSSRKVSHLPGGPPRPLGSGLSDIEDGEEIEIPKLADANSEEGIMGVVSKVEVGSTSFLFSGENEKMPVGGLDRRGASSRAGNIGVGITRTTEIRYESSNNDG